MRQPKPFFRTFTKTWYVTLNGRQINLGRDEQTAYEKYFELMARRGQAVATFSRVVDVFEAYLAWVGEHRSQGTYDKAVHYLSDFTKFIGKTLPIRSLQATQLLLWTEATDWTDTTRHDAISLVQRAFTWAVTRGHLRPLPAAPDTPR